ncbi:predicted protein [Streptomyces viridochromogenes DSM 40736]|uniref:Predicted protein n=1 Tax=Streptomyces viridochromogenes (strain DSM 40736 / JCM 4977 / BCRC 1201 / Tue 494) TaxID=591159 RepID=D9X089_STRVT|nr:predicted protein [Streptomyces viridochromogenes DSM 40736]
MYTTGVGNTAERNDADLHGPLRPGCKSDRTIPVKPDSTRNEELPIYESLVRERGDVVKEARVVSEETQHQATQALNGVATVGHGPSS